MSVDIGDSMDGIIQQYYLLQYTRQGRDEVSLQHRPQKTVNLTKLAMTHLRQQLLNKVHLFELRPLVEQLNTFFVL